MFRWTIGARYGSWLKCLLSGQSVDVVFRRIKPRNESDLEAIYVLYGKCQGHSIQELGEDPLFSEVFLNFKPTDCQLNFLTSYARQQTVLWTRQGGKTTSMGVKLFKRRVRRPGSQATITGPGLRQAKLVLEKLSDVLSKMDPIAYRAWVEKVLRTTIRLRNRSRLKAFPFSLEKLRGETSDDVDVEEAAFIKECEELVQGTLTPQMATRWGQGASIILNSTPWGREFYYKTLHDPNVSKFWTPFIADWQRISEILRRLKAKPNCSGNQLIKAYVPCQNGLFQVDFCCAKPATFGIHPLVRTGSAEHNMWLAAYTIAQGMRLKYSQGLIKDDKVVAGETEQSVFEAIGLPYPPPTQREITNEKPMWLQPSQTT